MRSVTFVTIHWHVTIVNGQTANRIICAGTIRSTNRTRPLWYKLNKAEQAKVKQPLQAWTGPEGSRRLRLPDFKTIGT